MLFEKIKNFFLYGTFDIDESVFFGSNDIRADLNKKMPDQKKLDVSKEERKAIYLGALQAFGPIFLILLVIVIGLFLITGKFFG